MAYKKVTPTVAAEMRCLYQVMNVRGKDLLKFIPEYSKANVYKQARRQIAREFVDSRKSNPGRPKKVDPALQRRVVREISVLQNSNESFTSKDVQENVAAMNMCNRTVRRAMQKGGFQFLHLRKKGLLHEDDLKLIFGWKVLVCTLTVWDLSIR